MRVPVVLCVAPNGARRSHAEHPAIPITAAEIGATAATCAEAGATVVHLHVRDEAGRHTLDAERYREAIAAIRVTARDRIVVQVTSEAASVYDPTAQMAAVRALSPRAVSIALREIVADEAAVPAAAKFYAWAARERVGIQHIVYDAEDATRLIALTRQGVLAESEPHALFVLGRGASPPLGGPRDLLPFLATWPAAWPWSVCAFGWTERMCLTAAIGLGGHVRVGFENNLETPDRERAEDNAANVRAVATLIDAAGKRLATLDEAQALYER